MEVDIRTGSRLSASYWFTRMSLDLCWRWGEGKVGIFSGTPKECDVHHIFHKVGLHRNDILKRLLPIHLIMH